jgi:hypothetical protein
MFVKPNFDIVPSSENAHLFTRTIMATELRRLALRLATPAAGLAATIAVALLYHVEPQYYYRVLGFIGIEPSHHPFGDLRIVLSWVDCWQRGLDVYFNNPCDGDGSVMDYPPLWLLFTFLPGEEWTKPLGLCIAISFFLALAFLPPPRSGRELLPRLIATLSPVTTFAVERGNMDLLMFAMATAAGILLLGPLRRRVAAYTIIVIAGLLKIYPLVLMALTLRERPRVFLGVTGTAATVVLATGVYFHAEIVKMVANLTPFTHWPPHLPNEAFSDVFGAYLLPVLFAQKVDAAIHPGLIVLRLVKVATFAALFLAMAGWFFCMVRWRDFRIALARLPDPDKIFLLIGAALIGGCFFAGPNFGYRGIYLLFTLPGLLAIALMKGDLRVRQVAVQECVLVIALTWVGFFTWHEPFQQVLAAWIGNTPATRLVHFLWLLSEIARWQVATLFVVILISCCFDWFVAAAGWHRLRCGEVTQV